MITIIKKLLSDKSKNVTSLFSGLSEEERKQINEAVDAEINTEDIIFDNKMNILKETFGISRNLPLNSQIKKQQNSTQVKIQNANQFLNKINNEFNEVKNSDYNSENEEAGLSYKSQDFNNGKNNTENEDSDDHNLGVKDNNNNSNFSLEEDEEDNLAAVKVKKNVIDLVDSIYDEDDLLKADNSSKEDSNDELKQDSQN